jgi:hypothetical protein
LQAAYYVLSHDTLLTDITSLLEVNQRTLPFGIGIESHCCQEIFFSESIPCAPKTVFRRPCS